MMDALTLKVLNKNDETLLDKLLSDVEKNLVDKKFWLPISKISRDHFFDSTWTYFLGAFADEDLVGAGALFFNENEWGESREAIGLASSSIAEFGRAMVRSDFKNKGIMTLLASRLLEVAGELDVEYLLATVHPNNVASQKVLEKIGMTKQGSVVKSGNYDRDIYLRKMF